MEDHPIPFRPQFATEEEKKAVALIALKEAKGWYNMLEHFVFDNPAAISKMRERLKFLAEMAGVEVPQ